MSDYDYITGNAEHGIKNREYLSGRETKYYILTIKIDSHRYQVRVLEGFAEIGNTDVTGRLDTAKREGVRLLLEYSSGVNQTEVTMVHYKHDRPSGQPWQKDSEKVVNQLLTSQVYDPLQKMNPERLKVILEKFAQYRKTDEAEYQENERQYKIEFLSYLGNLLHQIHTEPEAAKTGLENLVSGRDVDKRLVQYWNNLLSAMQGYSQRNDFHVFLLNMDIEEFKTLFMNLFEQGMTAEIREQFNIRYKSLFREGKFAPAKKSEPNMTGQFLAILLMAYDPSEYILYKATEYSNFAQYLELAVPGDVIGRYDLFKQMAHVILQYAEQNGFPVEDLIDSHNVVYMSGYKEWIPSRVTVQDPDIKGEIPELKLNSTQPKNLILYGPPGTGKTYNVIYEALRILQPNGDVDLFKNPNLRKEAVSLFNRYVDSNQVMFCTFHQSYSYEEFVEGIRFSQEKGQYAVQDGVFKKICDAARAATSERKNTYNFNPDDTQFFKMSLGNTLSGEDEEIYEYCLKNNEIALGYGGEIDYSHCADKQAIKRLLKAKYPNETKFAVDAVERFKNWMNPGDIVVISSGNTKARAIGKIIGEYTYKEISPIDYHHFRKVEWLYTDSNALLPVQSILKEKIFSQQTIYKFYDEDLNIESIQELISDNHDKNRDQQFVLVIDEINRGNISKIFGELITLIEADKRLGQPNEIPVQLPYSGERLRVPSNVHILGTMNTADRSIALLDTALRRRFEFKEMMPDYDVLPDNVEGINIRRMLEIINERIEFLYDRDHMIGHSYFILENADLADYIRVMKTKVIPLLQEYFYEDWEQIERVLGGAGNPGDKSYFLNRAYVDAGHLFAKTSGLPERRKTRYTVQTEPSPEALKRIYSAVVAMDSDSDEQDEEE